MIDTQVQPDSQGAIVFDRAAFRQAGLASPGADWFDPAHWAAAGRLESRRGGRGGVAFVATPLGDCVLRHYHRGGLAAAVSTDRYLWRGARRTRSYLEFRLLARMDDAGLPVPAPIAARHVRDRFSYRADILMRRLEPVHTLAERLTAQSLDPDLAGRVGRVLARFHAAGICHADLNAHNVLAGDDAGAAGSGESVWLVDFDRGRIRSPRLAWQQANLARLRRSFAKLGAGGGGDFENAFWHPLLAAYHDALAGNAVRREHEQ
jgi:3-deoxy-D-manno-octulosonic acid kinase